jgi:hypothetical protein
VCEGGGGGGGGGALHCTALHPSCMVLLECVFVYLPPSPPPPCVISDILVDNVRIVGLELNVREVAALSTLSFNKNRQTLLRTAQVRCCDASALHCMRRLGASLHATPRRFIALRVQFEYLKTSLR